MWQNTTAKQRAYLARRKQNKDGQVFLKNLEKTFDRDVRKILGERHPRQLTEEQLELAFAKDPNELFS